MRKRSETHKSASGCSSSAWIAGRRDYRKLTFTIARVDLPTSTRAFVIYFRLMGAHFSQLRAQDHGQDSPRPIPIPSESGNRDWLLGPVDRRRPPFGTWPRLGRLANNGRNRTAEVMSEIRCIRALLNWSLLENGRVLRNGHFRKVKLFQFLPRSTRVLSCLPLDLLPDVSRPRTKSKQNQRTLTSPCATFPSYSTTTSSIIRDVISPLVHVAYLCTQIKIYHLVTHLHVP